MTEFFADVDGPIPFAGRGDVGDPHALAYRVYDPDRVVAGKRMEDQLRIAVCYWHSFNWPGSDVFGVGTFDRPWLDAGADPMKAAFAKQDAAFEFFAKLGAPFYCFHDADMAPAGSTLRSRAPTSTNSSSGRPRRWKRPGSGCCGERPTCSRTHGTQPARPPILTPTCSPTRQPRCAPRWKPRIAWAARTT